MDPQEVLESLLDVVAALGEVVATVTGQHRDVRRRVSPEFLHAALRRFTQSLRETLDHGNVNSLGHRGVPSLGQALAALGATPGATRANVRAAAKAWEELVAALNKRWYQLYEEAIELSNACRDMANTQARNQQDEATHRGTAGDSLAATAQPLPVALSREEEASAGAAHEAQGAAAASEAVGEAVVATSRAKETTRRGHWAEVALGPLERLVDACDESSMFIIYMECQFEEIEYILAETSDTSPNVPEAAVAEAAKAERLWDASALLFTCHLLGILELIDNILLNPYGGPGGPGGPGGAGSRTVAERCQKAREDIPRLLQGQ